MVKQAASHKKSIQDHLVYYTAYPVKKSSIAGIHYTLQGGESLQRVMEIEYQNRTHPANLATI